MRIRRIRLENFRGVEAREVVFSDSAMSIVQGPNEIGKSSLAEAIDILFECRDDSRARRVRSLKPVDRDVGTGIEVDVVTGPYSFTYSKRFNRERRTELVIHEPSPENLTGREAHARAELILEETLDVALWKALRIHQGFGVRQASVEQSASLANALDLASGQGGGDSEENESLFAAVTAEYERWFTPTGREKKVLTDPRAALEEAAGRVAGLRARLDEVERDVERSERLAEEVARLASREAELRDEARRLRDELASIEGLRERADAAHARWEAARQSVDSLRQRRERRDEQVGRVATLVGELARLEDERRGHADADEALGAERDAAERELAERRAAEQRARRSADLARLDFEHWSDRDELEELGARRERIRQAVEAAADAQVVVATSRVTGSAVDRIREAYHELLVMRAMVRSKTPALRLETLADLVVELGGERVELPRGATREDAVTSELELVLPGLLRASVSPGEDVAAIRGRLDEAHAEYLAACSAIGVDDLETALDLLARRQQAEAKVAERDRAVAAELGERWTDELESRETELRGRVFGYLKARDAREPLPASREEARHGARTAAAALEEVANAADGAAARVQALRGRGEETRRALDAVTTRLSITEKEIRSARDALSLARTLEEDEVLVGTLDEAVERERRARVASEALVRELDAAGPDAVAARAANAEAALAKVAAELRSAETERTEVATRLVVHGEEGLAERFDRAEAERQHLARELDRVETRARAVALLHDTMRLRRDAARRAYQRPLRERIEELGRIVFGPGFSVELDEELRVKSRTLEGRTLPFEALSTGAREQIGVIARLACAMIVSGDGSGVPVILDDALGYSDPRRLKEMGVVLSVAGRHAQVILLTSVPDRYLHVGGAEVHRLE